MNNGLFAESYPTHPSEVTEWESVNEDEAGTNSDVEEPEEFLSPSWDS
jgi:hypothetical protein